MRVPRFLQRRTPALPPSDPASALDPVWYLRRYPDLGAALGSAAGARDHYLRHGLKEGRFANPAEEEEADYRRYIAPSESFDLAAYRLLNPDLAANFAEDREFILHYIRHGRAEGRRSVFDGDAAETRVWARLFDCSQYLAWVGSVQPEITNRAAAIQHFERFGMDAIAPIRFEWLFEPDFYRAHYDLGAGPDDRALYREWLDEGLSQARSPNEAAVLRPYLGHMPFPAGFDWSDYALANGVDAARGRAFALIHMVAETDDWNAVKAWLPNPSPAVVSALAAWRLRRGDTAAAAAILDAFVCPDETIVAADWAVRGAVAQAAGDTTKAGQFLDRAIAMGDTRFATLERAVLLATACGDHDAALSLLRRHRTIWQPLAAGEALVRTVIDRWFGRADADAHELLSNEEPELLEGGRVAAMNQRFGAQLAAIAAAIAELEPGPATLGAVTDGPIVLLANENLRQCTHYRVEQKAEAFALAGVPLIRHAMEDVERFLAALPGARAAIFYRVPATPAIMRAILTARAMGVPTWYEIDDLLFDPDAYPGPYAGFGGEISPEDYRGLQAGVPLFRAALSLCDRAIASTTPLLERMAPLTRQGGGMLLPNGLDSRNASLLASGRSRLANPAPAGPVRVFYGSGTRAHNADFSTLVVAALARLMEARPDVECVLVGHVPDDPQFAPFGSRVRRFALVDPIERYWSILAACDISLAVLNPGAVADCKSEIKWLEAAAAAVPTVASPTAALAGTIIDGQDGLLAATSEDWFNQLDRLAGDADLRRAIGAAAFKRARAEFGLEVTAERIRAAFAPPPATQAADPRLKVMVANVFLAPQSFGGATRVVEDTLRTMAADCSDLAFSALCSEEGAPLGRLRIGTFGAVPVYRLGVDHHDTIDTIAFDERNVAGFAHALDLERPDLVHFHCTQRLTASLARECLRRGLPYVITIHDGWWFSSNQFLVDRDGFLLLPEPDMFAGTRADATRRRELAPILAGAAAITTVSTCFAALCTDAGLSGVRVIANADAAPGPGPVPVPVPVPDRVTSAGPLRLGHIGGRSAHKGADLVEAAFRRGAFANLSLTIIDGRMPAGETVQTRWGKSAVTLAAPVPQAEVGALYAGLDVLLAPSRWPESFGLVAREAERFGLWIIAPVIGAMGDGVVDGVNGFKINTADRSSLDEILARLNAEPERFLRRATVSDAPARTAFDQAREYAALYREIAAQSLQR